MNKYTLKKKNNVEKKELNNTHVLWYMNEMMKGEEITIKRIA